MALKYNRITGTAALCRTAHWVICHDPKARAIVVCGDRPIDLPCELTFHHIGAIHSGTYFLYGRWWFPRSVRRAFDLAVRWAEAHSADGNEADQELEEALELRRLMESL